MTEGKIYGPMGEIDARPLSRELLLEEKNKGAVSMTVYVARDKHDLLNEFDDLVETDHLSTDEYGIRKYKLTIKK